MDKLEFLNYTETPHEKHLGIATIRTWGKIVLRFKIIARKDGSGNFVAPASYKISEQYVPCFAIDSNFDKESIEKFVLSHVPASNHSQAVPQQPQAYYQPVDQGLPF